MMPNFISMEGKNPLISIVMPSFNQFSYIEESLNSVINQNYTHKEIIIIDGGSTDGTLNIINKFANNITYWVSEPDNGQSHALNKGFSIANGDLVVWLNTDDIMLPGTLSSVAKYWKENGYPKWITGNSVWAAPDGRIIRCARGVHWSNILARLNMINVFAPSSFFSPEILDIVGNVDENLHYMMDTELWLRFANKGYKFNRIHKYMWVLRLHPNAKMSGHHFKGSPMAKANHKSHFERKFEKDKIADRYHITARQLRVAKVLSRAIRFKQMALPLSWFDLIRFYKRHWSECFNG
jgi:glycosyltransferase involved in cell wall biosynthesis